MSQVFYEEQEHIGNEDLNTPHFPNLQDDIENNTHLKCNQYFTKNGTFVFYEGYKGIPETLILNFILWLVILCLFSILRKNAWNYGRLSLVKKYENRWTQFVWEDSVRSQPSTSVDTASVESLKFHNRIDKGYFNWIKATLSINDEHVRSKCGRDAVYYLSFQRHLIIYMIIVFVVSMSIILPINFQGNYEGSEVDFGHTTLANIQPNSIFMWVHVTLGFLYLPIAIVSMRKLSALQGLGTKKSKKVSTKTLMISSIPKNACDKEAIINHFQEAYPEVAVQGIELSYDVKRLEAIDKQRDGIKRANLYCDKYWKDAGTRLQIRANRCKLEKVDAIKYYTDKEEKLNEEVEEEKFKSLASPTGIAFVTFDSIENAQKVLNDHSHSHRFLRCSNNPPTSRISVELKPHNWIISAAPIPEDICWSNLSVATEYWYCKAVLIYIALFFIAFFLSTPVVIANQLHFLLHADKNTTSRTTLFLSENLTPMVLKILAPVMPIVVVYSDKFMSHWTKSAENYSVMKKTYIFLLFMLIILPSLDMPSINYVVELIMLEKYNMKNATVRWECVLMPDNTSFFVNYVITSAFLGTALDLLRLPDFLYYIMQLSLTRSEAEATNVRRNVSYDFEFGVNYAWMLVIYSMTIIYSVLCPLITPFGLLYLIMKHFVDKYNIYFTYEPTRIEKNIHISAIYLMLIPVVLLQFFLCFLTTLRKDTDTDMGKALTTYSIVLILLTAVITHNTFFHLWFKILGPIQSKSERDDIYNILNEEEEETSTERFLPKVLSNFISKESSIDGASLNESFDDSLSGWSLLGT